MLFHYNTLTVKLFPLTKSLKVYFKETYINKEMLFELEGLFSWLEQHIEVSSVFFSSLQEYFCNGFCHNESTKLESDKLQSYLERIQKLTHAMNFLPQTFLVDLKAGSTLEGSEFALGADFIIAREESAMTFNHISNGKTPQSGGIGLLKSKVGFAKAKNWLMLEKKVSSKELLDSGLVSKLYSLEEKNPEQEILELINSQSPIARIQTKRALLESSLGEIENAKVYESLFAKATLSINDWKEFIDSKEDKRKPEFKKARELNL